jgi:hypothetical protein
VGRQAKAVSVFWERARSLKRGEGPIEAEVFAPKPAPGAPADGTAAPKKRKDPGPILPEFMPNAYQRLPGQAAPPGPAPAKAAKGAASPAGPQGQSPGGGADEPDGKPGKAGAAAPGKYDTNMYWTPVKKAGGRATGSGGQAAPVPGDTTDTPWRPVKPAARPADGPPGRPRKKPMTGEDFGETGAGAVPGKGPT